MKVGDRKSYEKILEAKFQSGTLRVEEKIKSLKEFDALVAQVDAANATARSATYTLWSAVAAAASAIASFGATLAAIYTIAHPPH